MVCIRFLKGKKGIGVFFKFDYDTFFMDFVCSCVQYSILVLNYFFCRVSIKESSVAKLGSVCRRVYRIFSHAYFHHRALFDEYEVSFNRPCSAAFPWPVLCHIHQAVLSYSLLELCSVCTPLGFENKKNKK